MCEVTKLASALAVHADYPQARNESPCKSLVRSGKLKYVYEHIPLRLYFHKTTCKQLPAYEKSPVTQMQNDCTKPRIYKEKHIETQKLNFARWKFTFFWLAVGQAFVVLYDTPRGCWCARFKHLQNKLCFFLVLVHCTCMPNMENILFLNVIFLFRILRIFVYLNRIPVVVSAAAAAAFFCSY